MSLTGGLVIWCAWLAAAATFCWVVMSWPRAAGPGWTAVLRRVGAQLSVLLVVLLAVGVSLNDQYGWYGNWSDLTTLFTGDAAGTVVAAGDDAAHAAGGVAIGPAGSGHSSVPLAGVADLHSLGLAAGRGPAAGQVRTYTIAGPISRLTSTVTVWFPAAYTDQRLAAHRFPVLEAFHGVPGTPAQLWNNMDLGVRFAAQVAAGRVADAVIVMPAYAPREVDSECVDGGAGQPQMEQWLARDVTTWVEQHLRVADDRGSWATLGISAGAWCASMLAMLHPDLYSAAISLGGYYQPSFEPPYVPFRAGTPQWQYYDLLDLVHRAPPRMALWVETSPSDSVSYGTTRQLLADARPPMSVTADVLPHGGHRLGTWLALIPQAVTWLGWTAPGFAPPASGSPSTGQSVPPPSAPRSALPPSVSAVPTSSRSGPAVRHAVPLAAGH